MDFDRGTRCDRWNYKLVICLIAYRMAGIIIEFEQLLIRFADWKKILGSNMI